MIWAPRVPLPPRPRSLTRSNTRITDPETLERRFPALLRTFSLRENSGGAGAFRGGEGVVREIEFRRVVTVSVLSERRALQPQGLCGGGAGARGVNTLLRGDSAAGASLAKTVNLGGKASFVAHPGDRLCVATPGGGGFGRVGAATTQPSAVHAHFIPRAAGSILAMRETESTA